MSKSRSRSNYGTALIKEVWQLLDIRSPRCRKYIGWLPCCAYESWILYESIPQYFPHFVQSELTITAFLSSIHIKVSEDYLLFAIKLYVEELALCISYLTRYNANKAAISILCHGEAVEIAISWQVCHALVKFEWGGNNSERKLFPVLCVTRF